MKIKVPLTLLFFKECIKAVSPNFIGVFTCLLFTVCIHLNLSAQDNKPAKQTWVSDGSKNNVSFYHTIANCNGESVVLLKFINKNSRPVKIQYTQLFKTSKVPEMKEGFKKRIEILLPVGETLASGCTDEKREQLIITSKDVSLSYKAEIIDFRFSDITVASIL